MAQKRAISGFSKLTADEKISWLENEFSLPSEYQGILKSHLHKDSDIQSVYNDFSENTISNFYIPFGLAPNFLINGEWFVIPMAIEESSVVAAASHAAKFWSANGGFKAEVLGQVKIGQVHFYFSGESASLLTLFKREKTKLIKSLEPLTESMVKRGGGIKKLECVDQTDLLDNYYQLHVEFLTADAMGANFINSVLEKLAAHWKELIFSEQNKGVLPGDFEINMSILSNYTPESIVKVHVECAVDSLSNFDSNLSGMEFAEKFVRATEIARANTYRAVTHNKGIFNGMDAVILATGNDFRAVEACGHAYASHDGKYRGLSYAKIEKETFHFELNVPMSIGVVGGLTSGHPLAKASLKILKDPSAEQLMKIVASAGLANNFSAVRSLISGGIQKGHMKMHLANILRQLNASEQQKNNAIAYFKDRTLSYADVKKFVQDNK